jgi:hypothetical protein
MGVHKYHDMLDALDSVTWYNDLAECVFKWIFIKPDKTGHIHQSYKCETSEEEHQLQVLWMIAVCLFGKYGTSPRTGWIEDIDGFRNWCLAITETWRSSGYYDGPECYRA